MELKVLHQHGWSISALAREFGLSRNTVRRELAADGPRHYPERAKPTELSEAQLAHVERRLTVCPTIRGSDLWAELRADYGYQGSYPAFTRHLRTVRPAAQTEPEVRFETGPGIQVQMDWGHFGLLPLEVSLVDLFGMVAVLGCSRAPSIRFATDRTRSTTLERAVSCLADLGGAPKEILTDRDPAFCIGATSDGRAMLAPEWVELCQTLELVLRACRPYRAQTKGKVERMIREIKDFFPGSPARSCPRIPPSPTMTDWRSSGESRSCFRASTAPRSAALGMPG